MKIILIILGVIIYLFIGMVLVAIFNEPYDDEILPCVMFWPILIIGVAIIGVGELLNSFFLVVVKKIRKIIGKEN